MDLEERMQDSAKYITSFESLIGPAIAITLSLFKVDFTITSHNYNKPIIVNLW